MKIRKIVPFIFVLFLGCVAPQQQLVEPAPYVDRHVLLTKDYNRACNDVQADLLFMFDSGSNEASFVDYGTRAVYRIGKRRTTEVPTSGTSVLVPRKRGIDEVKWYTSVEFLSFGDKCSVTVRELNRTNDKKLNGESIIELLQQLER